MITCLGFITAPLITRVQLRYVLNSKIGNKLKNSTCSLLPSSKIMIFSSANKVCNSFFLLFSLQLLMRYIVLVKSL